MLNPYSQISSMNISRTNPHSAISRIFLGFILFYQVICFNTNSKYLLISFKQARKNAKFFQVRNFFKAIFKKRKIQFSKSILLELKTLIFDIETKVKVLLTPLLKIKSINYSNSFSCKLAIHQKFKP